MIKVCNIKMFHPKYKIEIKNIIPHAMSSKQLLDHNCYLGISIDNPMFSEDYLFSMVLWISKNFRKGIIIIGDYLNRFNEKTYFFSDTHKANLYSMQKGEDFNNSLSEFLTSKELHNLHIMRWKYIYDSVEYTNSKNIVVNFINSDLRIETSIRNSAKEFIDRQLKNGKSLKVSYEDAIGLSYEYLVEEITVFNAISEKGYAIEIYPGPELPILVDIANSKFSNIPSGLRKRINIELQLSMNGDNNICQ